MSRLDDEATVLELACLTQDRTRAEQNALRRYADRLDKEWNRRIRTDRWNANPPPARRREPSRQRDLVDTTWLETAE